ncbi:UDP-N-acetylmuramate--L-alanine ligase [Streptomyces sp. NPDC058579]|uniref:UDP-N-acetylmuramate--L-alanine ligase n=1 Tax=Streptomyces sp. NPDC058579 TaxID=3346548 RepID=UPI003651D96B
METAVPTIAPTVLDAAPDLSRVHFVGVGGTGMLPLARVLAEQGLAVSGSDICTSAALDELGRSGVTVNCGHQAGNVPQGATAVVFTHAVAAGNPEVQEARRRGIPLVHRSTALNAAMAGRTSVGVLGTHGKTSTAGMLAVVLARMGQDPSYVVGGELHGPASGGRNAAGRYFVAEVDESDRTHLNVAVDLAVVTDVDHDHPENYADLAAHIDAYESFALGMRSEGTLVVNADSPAAQELVRRLTGARGDLRLVTVGFRADAQWRVGQVRTMGTRSTARLTGPRGAAYELALVVPGTHQLANAACAVAMADALGLDAAAFVAELGCFDGVQRRMTPAGSVGAVRVYDSYAHHPTEIRADLAAAQSPAGVGKVVVVFQPAGAARHHAFGDGFAEALAGADVLVLTGTGRGADEQLPEELVTHAAVVETDRAQAVLSALAITEPGDVVVLMGTGDLADHGQGVVTGESVAAA